jgi:hypothetical protein
METFSRPVDGFYALRLEADYCRMTFDFLPSSSASINEAAAAVANRLYACLRVLPNEPTQYIRKKDRRLRAGS